MSHPRRMPLLTDPWFAATFYGNVSADDRSRQEIPSIDGAQGVQLWCPCGYGDPRYPLSGGRPHMLMIPFRNPRNAPPCPENHGMLQKGNHDAPRPRWVMSGTGLADLTVHPSVDVGDPSCWHGWIQGGEVR